MNQKDIINFSKFFETELTSKLSQFSKDDFSEFFVNEESDQEVEIHKLEVAESEPPFDPPVEIEDFEIDEEEPAELDVEDSLGSYQNKNNFTKVKESVENFYPVYKDKSENFSCDVSVEGAKISETQARLILESDEWTLMFNGDIDRQGKCTIPMRKLSILEEGIVGKIRLEVIAENTVFIPWEDDFKVKVSKKVTVQVNESRKSTGPNRSDTQSNVKVKIR
jgi:hypothetical protein